MNKKNIMFLSFAILLFIIAIAIFIYANSNVTDNNPNNPIQNPTISSKEKAEFSFYDEEKNKFKISEFNDKAMALILWSSDTENSLDIIELLDNVYAEYKDKINFLVINTNEPNNDIINLVKECNFSIPVYYDLNQEASEYYSFEKLPTLIFFEEDGTISKQTEENITEDALLANLDIISKNY